MCFKIDGVFPFVQKYIKQRVCNIFILCFVIALIFSGRGFVKVDLSLRFTILGACFSWQ